MWRLYAFLSALFAALTAIFAKVGVKDVNSNLMELDDKFGFVDICIEDTTVVITFKFGREHCIVSGTDEIFECLDSKSIYEFALKLLEFQN